MVIGAGAIGAAIAYALRERGARVAVLERSHVTRGCSYGNAGLICPSHAEALASPAAIRDGLVWMTRRDSPFHIRPRPSLVPWLARFGAAALRSREITGVLRRLATESLALHAAQARALPTSFARRGLLSVYESPRSFARAGGAKLTASEARQLEPALSPSIAGAVHHPEEAHCDPERYVAALLAGADVRTGVEVLRLARTNGRVDALETTAGTIRAGAVVLAAGVWTRDLLGARLPLEGAKGYHVELDEQPLRAGMPIYMEDARVVATPLGGRLRLSGTLDLSGLDASVDPVRVEALRRAGRAVLRLPSGARTVAVWRGLRPCAPDGLPIIGRPDGLENLVLATGHAMLGITLAPITAKIVSDIVAGRPEIPALSPTRFGGARA